MVPGHEFLNVVVGRECTWHAGRIAPNLSCRTKGLLFQHAMVDKDEDGEAMKDSATIGWKGNLDGQVVHLTVDDMVMDVFSHSCWIGSLTTRLAATMGWRGA